MPTRIVREGILTSERVNSLSHHAELFYRRLMSVVDDYGRFQSNAMLLRASCYPLKLDSVKEDSISRHLAECVAAKLIVLYTVAGKGFLQLQDFGQRINGKPKFPGPDQGFTETIRESPGIPGNPRLDVGVVEDVIVDEKDQKSIARASRVPPQQPNLLADVSPQVAADFSALRKQKRAPLTATAVEGIRREATKAGLTLDAALAVCCERGWTGFRSDWDWRATAGPQKSGGATSKAGQAIEFLERLKNGQPKPDSGTHATVVVPRIGETTGG